MWEVEFGKIIEGINRNKNYRMERLLIAAFLFLAVSCTSNSGNNEDETTEATGTEHRGVENVNGNIPDTISTGAEPMTNYGSDTTDTTNRD
jgi:hypothetical protein